MYMALIDKAWSDENVVFSAYCLICKKSHVSKAECKILSYILLIITIKKFNSLYIFLYVVDVR